jgi:hypothetical protein
LRESCASMLKSGWFVIRITIAWVWGDDCCCFSGFVMLLFCLGRGCDRIHPYLFCFNVMTDGLVVLFFKTRHAVFLFSMGWYWLEVTCLFIMLLIGISWLLGTCWCNDVGALVWVSIGDKWSASVLCFCRFFTCPMWLRLDACLVSMEVFCVSQVLG